jgi:hypothetical protein
MSIEQSPRHATFDKKSALSLVAVLFYRGYYEHKTNE